MPVHDCQYGLHYFHVRSAHPCRRFPFGIAESGDDRHGFNRIITDAQEMAGTIPIGRTFAS
jgi:hypothetical protein